jgi:hypothetical protein
MARTRKKTVKRARPLARRARRAATGALAADSGPFPYLAVSASILHDHPDAPRAREALVQRIDMEPHQWATADTVVVQIQTNSQMVALLDDLDTLNQDFDPCFAGIAFLVPHKQTWWLSDRPINLPAIVAITGREPR